MRLRAVRRAVALAFALALCVLRYWLARVRGPLTLQRRALWLQSSCRLILASLGIHYCVEGRPPVRGVVVANHLSYLDIVILSAAIPCFFVAKAEIKALAILWRSSAHRRNYFHRSFQPGQRRESGLVISKRLELPIPVLFFPEGTSTDGSSLLPFHSRLFEPRFVPKPQ